MGREAASSRDDSTAGEHGAPQFLPGQCSHPECVMKSEDRSASAAGSKHQPAVLTECTFSNCTAGRWMHAECYERMESLLTRNLDRTNRPFADLKPFEKIRHMWTPGLKYELVRPHCRCACGQGFLRVLLHPNAKHGVQREGDVDDDLTASEKRKAKIEATLKVKAQREAEAKAKEREERSRLREEARERNQQRKEERKLRGADAERHSGSARAERLSANSPTLGVQPEDDWWREAGLQPPPPPPQYMPMVALPQPPMPPMAWGAGYDATPCCEWAPMTSGPWPPPPPPPTFCPGPPVWRQDAPLPVSPRAEPLARSFDLEKEASSFPALGGAPTVASGDGEAGGGGSGSGSAGSDVVSGGGVGGGGEEGGVRVGADGGTSTAGDLASPSNVPVEARETCPICLDVGAADVMLSPCGHTVCSKCLEGWSNQLTSYASTALRASSQVSSRTLTTSLHQSHRVRLTQAPA